MLNTRHYLSATALALLTVTAAYAADRPQSTELSLDLPRVSNVRASLAPIEDDQYDAVVIDRRTQGAGRVKMRDGVNLLEIAPGADWSAPLRKNGDNTFASVGLYASNGTELDIGGMFFRVEFSGDGLNFDLLRLESGNSSDRWAPCGVSGVCETYGGVTLAPLPTLTVRVNLRTRVADLYSGNRCIGAGLVAAPTQRFQGRSLAIRGGDDGVWIAGIMRSDVNPLFEDENLNAISDSVEREANSGRLLSANPTEEQAISVHRRWSQVQKQAGAATNFRRLKPDRLAITQLERAQDSK